MDRSKRRSGRVGPGLSAWFCLLAGACAPASKDALVTESTQKPLYMTGTRWPSNGTTTQIPVCLGATAQASPQLAAQVRQWVEESWPTVANVSFTGWGNCPSNTNGMVRVNFPASGNAHNADLGFGGNNITHEVNLLPGGGLRPGVAIHEFGHILGFWEEHLRPDFLDESVQCGGVDTHGGNTFGTPADRTSVMATNYCNPFDVLSFWDRRGVQHADAYGRRTRFTRDGSMNGDFRADLLYFDQATGRMSLSGSTGSAFVAWTWLEPGEFGSNRDNFFPGDFDGDQALDLGYQETNDNSFHVNISGVFRGSGPGGGRWVSPNGFGTTAGRYYVGDYNGDGRDDLGYFQPSDNTFHVALSTGAGFFGAGSGLWIGSGGFGSKRDNFFPADYNGDGFTDLGYFEDTNSSFHVTLSTGSGFNGPGSGVWVPAGGFGSPNGRYYVADYNGDGRDDLGFFEGATNSFHVAISIGAGFFGPGSGLWITSGGFGTDGSRYYPGDFNGDRLADIGYFDTNNNTFSVAISTGAGINWGASGQWIASNQFGDATGRHYVTSTRRR